MRKPTSTFADRQILRTLHSCAAGVENLLAFPEL